MRRVMGDVVEQRREGGKGGGSSREWGWEGEAGRNADTSRVRNRREEGRREIRSRSTRLGKRPRESATRRQTLHRRRRYGNSSLLVNVFFLWVLCQLPVLSFD